MMEQRWRNTCVQRLSGSRQLMWRRVWPPWFKSWLIASRLCVETSLRTANKLFRLKNNKSSLFSLNNRPTQSRLRTQARRMSIYQNLVSLEVFEGNLYDWVRILKRLWLKQFLTFCKQTLWLWVDLSQLCQIIRQQLTATSKKITVELNWFVDIWFGRCRPLDIHSWCLISTMVFLKMMFLQSDMLIS